MKHNNFDLKKDLIDHLKDFLFVYIHKYSEENQAYYDTITSDIDEEVKIEDPINIPLFMFNQPEQ